MTPEEQTEFEAASKCASDFFKENLELKAQLAILRLRIAGKESDAAFWQLMAEEQAGKLENFRNFVHEEWTAGR